MSTPRAWSPLEVSKALYAHVQRADWDKVAELVTEDFVIYEPTMLPYGGEWRGRDAFQRLYARVMGFWDDPVIESQELLGGERHAVAVLTLTATVPHTGVRFTQHIAEVSAFADSGLVESMRIHYFDTGEMARLLAGGGAAAA